MLDVVWTCSSDSLRLAGLSLVLLDVKSCAVVLPGSSCLSAPKQEKILASVGWLVADLGVM
jgi:hypothetical protein